MDSLLYIVTSAYYYSTLIMAPYVLLRFENIFSQLKQKKKNSYKMIMVYLFLYT